MDVSERESRMVAIATKAVQEKIESTGKCVRYYHSDLLKATTRGGLAIALKSVEPRHLEKIAHDSGIEAARLVAFRIRENLLEYYELLRKAEVPVSDLYSIEVDISPDDVVLVEVSKDAGEDLRTILQKHSEHATRHISEVIHAIKGVLHNPMLGIDTNPANFCLTKGDGCGWADLHFVDLFPPMFLNKDGVYLVGFPQPECRLAECNKDRYYTDKGALRILRFNLMRINSGFEEEFLHALQNSMDTCHARELIDFFMSLPDQKALTLLRDGKKDDVCALIMERDQFKIDDLREIAFRILPNNPAILDELFKLTMMNFLIPEEERKEKLQTFKCLLVSEVCKL